MTFTLFNNALHFDGTGGAYLTRRNTTDDFSPLSRTAAAPSGASDGKTGSNSQPWASSTIFNIESLDANNNSVLWSKGSGGKDQIILKLDTSGKLVLTIGKIGANDYIKFTSSNTFSTNQWNAIYIDYDGRSTLQADSYSSRFRIKNIDLSNGNAADLAGIWSAFGAGSQLNVTGGLAIGSNINGNKNFSGDIAAFAISTLDTDTTLPDDTQIDKFVRDPKTWLSDYKLGEKFRNPSDTFTQTNTNFTMDGSGNATSASSKATQIYLFGDNMPLGGGRSDSYSDMLIRNRVYPGYTQVELIQGSATDFSSGSFKSIYTPLSPSIASVSASTADGSYGVGEVISLNVLFSAAVNVVTTGGTPTLELETGNTDRAASYTSGSGTTTINFTYTVQEGDNSSDLDFTGTSALTLNGGTIKASNGAANNANLTLASPGAANSLADNSSIIVDTIAPTITVAINDGGDGSLNAAEDSSVTISGTTSGVSDGQTVSINISSSGGGTPINTTAAINSNSYSATGLDLSTLNDGTLTITADVSDLAGNSAIQASDTSTKNTATSTNNTASKYINFDTTPPTITITDDDADDSLSVGDTSTITFTFSEDVRYFEESDVTISGGSLSNWRRVTSTVYTATFTPSSNSKTEGVISVGSGGFTDLEGNKNQDGNDTDNYVTFNVDTIVPTVLTVSSSTSDGIYKTDDTITINVVFSEAVTVNTTGNPPQLILDTGSTEQIATYSSGTGTNTLVFTYTVQAGDSSSDLNYKDRSSLLLNSSTIQDSSSNDATLTLPVQNGGSSLADNRDIVIDTTAPTITVTNDDTGDFLSAGDSSTLTFTLSEAANDFIQSDVDLTGGSLTNWTRVSRSVYTATFTPSSNITTEAVISVGSGVFSDSAGNYNNDGSDTNNSITFTVYKTTPTQVFFTISGQDQTNAENSLRSDLILDIDSIVNHDESAIYGVNPRSNICQTIINLDNKATGNDNEETGEKFRYRIVEGNDRSLFKLSNTGVLSFLPRKGAFTKDQQIFPLTISISSSKHPDPAKTQLVVVLPAKKLTKRTCNPLIFQPDEEGNQHQLQGNACNNTIKGDYSFTALHGRKGHDLLVGHRANDSLYGGKGHDTIRAGSGKDLLHGHKGHDLLKGKDGDDTIHGQSGRDILRGGFGNDILRGGLGNDTLRGGLGNDTLRGGSNDDTLKGQEQSDLLHGRIGNDLLRGQRGNDKILGGLGDDTLRGGAGNDTLKGGQGADRYRISKGNDIILDFNPMDGDTIYSPPSASLQLISHEKDLILIDPIFNINTTILNTSLDDLSTSRPDLGI